ncbi:hypothetical protein F7725_011757 [Dissostichus mawsoni]|uniref:Uncharacterized protein n=1 Tax=Dissostichus mawsoni TaxID=36200 RepID=A0A7J5ZA42_DISMA|nr:hypothetical protein F7725_011757 [Dissostichus mawsoni]
MLRTLQNLQKVRSCSPLVTPPSSKPLSCWAVCASGRLRLRGAWTMHLMENTKDDMHWILQPLCRHTLRLHSTSSAMEPII